MRKFVKYSVFTCFLMVFLAGCNSGNKKGGDKIIEKLDSGFVSYNYSLEEYKDIFNENIDSKDKIGDFTEADYSDIAGISSYNYVYDDGTEVAISLFDQADKIESIWISLSYDADKEVWIDRVLAAISPLDNSITKKAVEDILDELDAWNQDNGDRREFEKNNNRYTGVLRADMNFGLYIEPIDIEE